MTRATITIGPMRVEAVPGHGVRGGLEADALRILAPMDYSGRAQALFAMMQFDRPMPATERRVREAALEAGAAQLAHLDDPADLEGEAAVQEALAAVVEAHHVWTAEKRAVPLPVDAGAMRRAAEATARRAEAQRLRRARIRPHAPVRVQGRTSSHRPTLTRPARRATSTSSASADAGDGDPADPALPASRPAHGSRVPRVPLPTVPTAGIGPPAVDKARAGLGARGGKTGGDRAAIAATDPILSSETARGNLDLGAGVL